MNKLYYYDLARFEPAASGDHGLTVRVPTPSLVLMVMAMMMVTLMLAMCGLVWRRW